MGWEIKEGRFFCNTSDEFFGPHLDEDIWPDHDSWYKTYSDTLFHDAFYKFLHDNPQKRKGVKTPTSDPRAMTPKYLETLVWKFEEQWVGIKDAADKLIEFAEQNQCNAFEVLNGFHQQTDFTPKKRTKRAAKKKGRK